MPTPQPKYKIIPVWDVTSETWITEVPMIRKGARGENISGIDVVAEFDPDAEFTYEYEEFDSTTQLMVIKTKTDWLERQTFFIPDGSDQAEILSAAAWNHYNELHARFSSDIPEAPEPEEFNALPQD